MVGHRRTRHRVTGATKDSRQGHRRAATTRAALPPWGDQRLGQPATSPGPEEREHKVPPATRIRGRGGVVVILPHAARCVFLPTSPRSTRALTNRAGQGPESDRKRRMHATCRHRPAPAITPVSDPPLSESARRTGVGESTPGTDAHVRPGLRRAVQRRGFPTSADSSPDPASSPWET